MSWKDRACKLTPDATEAAKRTVVGQDSASLAFERIIKLREREISRWEEERGSCGRKKHRRETKRWKGENRDEEKQKKEADRKRTRDRRGA